MDLNDRAADRGQGKFAAANARQDGPPGEGVFFEEDKRLGMDDAFEKKRGGDIPMNVRLSVHCVGEYLDALTIDTIHLVACC